MAESCVAIFGPGLLGGSLAMAVRERRLASRVHVWARRPQAARDVAERGLADLADTAIAPVVADASLVILATPVAFMAPLASAIAACATQPGLLVTDVGSVKESVVAQVGAALRPAAIGFIGSHPMAGSEQAGMEAARPDLFDDAACILTPDATADPEHLRRLVSFWSSLGCRVSLQEPRQHDETVGRISHLPHLAACALTLAALRRDASAAALAGKGFRDSTRIASGDAELWLGILRENRRALLEPLRDLQGEIARVLAMLEHLDEELLLEFLTEAKTLRDHCQREQSRGDGARSSGLPVD